MTEDLIEEPIDRPSFDKKPYERKHLDTNQDVVTLRLNAQERQRLQDLKHMLHIDADGTTLKIGLELAHNVLHTTFGKELISYIASPRRVRPGPR